MADSNITKKALASALKELMEEVPFSKISVSDICEKCNMNRKSFYYHFKDKYDLVNWIFDNEFITVLISQGNQNTWDLLSMLYTYFYNNRSFYKKILSITGQNSFSEHFHSLLYSTIYTQLTESLGTEKANEFQVNFFTDAIVVTFQRWIMSTNSMPPAEFMEQLKFCMGYIADTYKEMR